MKILLLALIVSCTPLPYAVAYDSCSFDYAGDDQAIIECQCQVDNDYGRSCSVLMPADGGQK